MISYQECYNSPVIKLNESYKLLGVPFSLLNKHAYPVLVEP